MPFCFAVSKSSVIPSVAMFKSVSSHVPGIERVYLARNYIHYLARDFNQTVFLNCTFKKTVWLKSRANWDALAAECDAINVTAILGSENSMRALNHVLLVTDTDLGKPYYFALSALF